MRSYRLFVLVILLVIVCGSCSEQSDSKNSINFFQPDKSRIEQYRNRTTRGTARPDVGTMSKSMQDRKYENDNETLFGYLTAVIGLIALIVLGVLLERYLMYRMKVTADSPSALFIELCAAHQLTRMERLLVERVAEAADINDPLPVFMEPKYLADAIDNLNFKNSRQMIEYLLTKLFESKAESSVIKRSSILLQSELDSEIKTEIRAGNSGYSGNSGKNPVDTNDSTVIYATAQNNLNKPS
ncbi:MAG: hypothetical protein LBK06_07890 [Planctomycetaceae bacterium]|jgi:hypothetical protein|nr:hypothetical protein [Planctomycetaceae bacterium]